MIRKFYSKGGINVTGEPLNHLRFADDAVLIVNSSREVNKMLQELNVRSKETGLKINASKTRVMQSTDKRKANSQVGGVVLAEVDSYIRLEEEV